MGFVKSAQELAAGAWKTGDFHDAEMLTVFFETTPKTLNALLPPPLKPAALPIGFVFVANYPRTNFGVTYRESALFLRAEFGGEEGSYCLSMPVTNDIALILGREIYGYPKKMADIHLVRRGKGIEGWTARHGVRFLEIKAKLTGKCNDEMAQTIIAQSFQSPSDVLVYNFKYFPAPQGNGFDYNPRLVREIVRMNHRLVEFGEATLKLQSSPHDPWADVEVVRVLGAVRTVGDNSMLPGSVVAETDAAQFAPFGFMKLDDLRGETR
ncbi:MAG: acetoacetate decarboxylase [Chloroflexi bacterium]|nr:acetoacetate decarboxylase [Chloroflexota bacterium]